MLYGYERGDRRSQRKVLWTSSLCRVRANVFYYSKAPHKVRWFTYLEKREKRGGKWYPRESEQWDEDTAEKSITETLAKWGLAADQQEKVFKNMQQFEEAL